MESDAMTTRWRDGGRGRLTPCHAEAEAQRRATDKLDCEGCGGWEREENRSGCNRSERESNGAVIVLFTC